MTPSGCCRGPCSHRAEEESRDDRKGDNDSTAAGAGYRRLGVCDGHIGTLLGIRRRKARRRCHHLCKIGAVVIGHAGVAGRCQEDAAVCTGILNPDVVVVKSAKDGV
jgi:hypothetical protein